MIVLCKEVFLLHSLFRVSCDRGPTVLTPLYQSLMSMFMYAMFVPYIFSCFATIAGMNSIFVYVGSEMVRGFPFFWDGPNTHIKLLSENLIAVSLWVAVSYYCYWIGFFVEI